MDAGCSLVTIMTSVVGVRLTPTLDFMCQIFLSQVHRMYSSPQKSVQYALKALEILQKNNSGLRGRELVCFNALALAYIQAEDIGNALFYLRKIHWMSFAFSASKGQAERL